MMKTWLTSMVPRVPPCKCHASVVNVRVRSLSHTLTPPNLLSLGDWIGTAPTHHQSLLLQLLHGLHRRLFAYLKVFDCILFGLGFS